MSHVYDVASNLAVKDTGVKLVDVLAELSGLEGFAAETFGRAACRAAFGIEPDGRGPNPLSDPMTRDQIPIFTASLATMVLVAAVLRQQGLVKKKPKHANLRKFLGV